MKILTPCAWMMMMCAVSTGAARAEWNLMPQPAQITPGQGKLKIDQTFRVALTGYREPRLERAAARLIVHLERLTGMTLTSELASSPAEAALEIATTGASLPVQKLGEDESYRLEVTPAHARITTANPLGVLHGMETFLQLVQADKDSFSVPAVAIDDRPRFGWRGTMLDVSRHWMPVEVVERTLDAMAAVKLNVFHWHLSDDQGFRVECKRFPKLQELGSDGHFYTQQQIHEVIEYARDRGIRVVPEFDMPGHATAWFVGYPELASGPGPYSIERKWGIFDPAIDPTRDEVYQFLDGLIGEMTALFPDDYFHIGGDEVNGNQWKTNPRIRDFMITHNMKNTEDLQASFSRRVVPMVTKYGKKVIGWDEILSSGSSGRHGHTILARPEIPGRSRPPRFRRYSFRALLFGPDALRGGSLCGRSARKGIRRSDRRAESSHPRRRVLHVGRVRHNRQHRYENLAAQRRHRRAPLVAARGERRRPPCIAAWPSSITSSTCSALRMSASTTCSSSASPRIAPSHPWPLSPAFSSR